MSGMPLSAKYCAQERFFAGWDPHLRMGMRIGIITGVSVEDLEGPADIVIMCPRSRVAQSDPRAGAFEPAVRWLCDMR